MVEKIKIKTFLEYAQENLEEMQKEVEEKCYSLRLIVGRIKARRFKVRYKNEEWEVPSSEGLVALKALEAQLEYLHLSVGFFCMKLKFFLEQWKKIKEAEPSLEEDFDKVILYRELFKEIKFAIMNFVYRVHERLFYRYEDDEVSFHRLLRFIEDPKQSSASFLLDVLLNVNSLELLASSIQRCFRSCLNLLFSFLCSTYNFKDDTITRLYSSVLENVRDPNREDLLSLFSIWFTLNLPLPLDSSIFVDSDSISDEEY